MIIFSIVRTFPTHSIFFFLIVAGFIGNQGLSREGRLVKGWPQVFRS